MQRPRKVRVEFYAIDGHDQVGGKRRFVKIDRCPVVQAPDPPGFDGRHDRHAEGLLRQAVARKDLALARLRAAAVAAHRRHEKRESAELLERCDGRLHDFKQVPDAAAPHRDGDFRTRAHPLRDVRVLQRTAHGCGRVL